MTASAQRVVQNHTQQSCQGEKSPGYNSYHRGEIASSQGLYHSCHAVVYHISVAEIPT